MKNFSNKYIFLYATIVVAVVAILLSVVATGLKSRQQANVRNEKMQSLLAAINVEVARDQAAEMYKQYFTQELNVTTTGNIVDIYQVAADAQQQGDQRPFEIDLKGQQVLEAQQPGEARFPVYCYEKDGQKGYVLPMRGAGLWGAIWGYIAIAEDCNRVEGVTFDHEGETPGLGAEITTEKFCKPFIGKQIMDETGKVVSIAVKKHADKAAIHEVDAITGGTMTSNGVSAMLETDIQRYQNFFDNQLKGNQLQQTVSDFIETASDATSCQDADSASQNGKEAK